MLKLCAFLLNYEKQTGQKINLSKSGFIAGKRANSPVISQSLQISELTFPFQYLGAPISKGRNKKILFLPLLERVRARFTSWNLDMLSQGSRLVLIKSVLNALPVYLIQALHPPKSVLLELRRIFANFFWGSSLIKSRMHWTKWSNLCFPIEEKRPKCN